MGQEPHCQRRCTLTACRIWRGVVEITVHIEHMNMFPMDLRQRLNCSDSHAAIAPDQERDLSRFSQEWDDPLTHAVPHNPRSRPTPDWWNLVMGQIAGDRYIAFIDRIAPGCQQTLEELHIAICLSVVLAPGKQGTGSQWNSQHVIGVLGDLRLIDQG